MQLFDAFQQAERLGLLEQVTACAGADGGKDGVIVAVHREHQDGKTRKQLVEAANSFDTGHARQADIGQDQVGRRTLDGGQGLLHGAVRPRNPETGGASDERGQSFARAALILNQGDTNWVKAGQPDPSHA